jgi:hypothetical protein
MIWSSDQGDPPYYTPVANGVIEQLLGNNYFVSAYWDQTRAEGMQVVIDISLPHGIFSEFPGMTISRVVCGPPPTAITAIGRHREAGLYLDAVDPESFQKLNRFLKAAGRHDPSGSASKSPA